MGVCVRSVGSVRALSGSSGRLCAFCRFSSRSDQGPEGVCVRSVGSVRALSGSKGVCVHFVGSVRALIMVQWASVCVL